MMPAIHHNLQQIKESKAKRGIKWKLVLGIPTLKEFSV